MACWSEFVVNFSVAATWHVWVVLYAEGCGVSSAECFVGVKICTFI